MQRIHRDDEHIGQIVVVKLLGMTGRGMGGAARDDGEILHFVQNDGGEGERDAAIPHLDIDRTDVDTVGERMLSCRADSIDHHQ